MNHPIITINGTKAIGILEQDEYKIRFLPGEDRDGNDLFVLDLPIVVGRGTAEFIISYLSKFRHREVNMTVM